MIVIPKDLVTQNLIPEENKKVGVGFGIMVMRSGQVLLGKRHEDPTKADSELHGEESWSMPGGKLEYGETFEEGFARELMEETGIQLKEFRILCINNDKNESEHFVTIGLLAKKYNGEPKVREPEKITDWKWFDLNKIPTNMYFPSAKIIENYKQGKFYIEGMD